MSNPAAADLEQGSFIDVNGVRTHYHEAGQGRTLVLIHGSGPGVSAWSNWRQIIPDLAERYHVVAYDQVGFNGTQGEPGAGYGRETWTRHGLDFLDALGIEDFDVAGNSMGGAVALSMAVAAPQRVGRLVLMGAMGVPATIPPGLDELWAYTPSHDNMRRSIELLAHDQSVNTPELVELRYRASTAPGIDEAWQRMFPAPRQRWWDDLALSYEELATIAQPTLLVHGRDDKVIPFAETSLRLLDLLRDVRLVGFGDAGHWVQIERRAEFLAQVTSFLEASAPAA
ncbi:MULTISPECIES: alpha/beta fold hydrolase [unclassified Nocardioides]|uniref:alpha/beta fold hydrolase n=1 Tax=unclassified Nocardioides TaxID=2615069 RepID=UPI0009EF95DE|nr:MULTISPECIES: alpha/beta hydrolase [unclassified Nocardioides]GAW50119.1 Alpha/beta hydrolase fold protein [Nocardioides sp. PD653-B2]GAW54804.1 Alpha/beta hydrolase fold protein [Nocardioides sp. PD653]